MPTYYNKSTGYHLAIELKGKVAQVPVDSLFIGSFLLFTFFCFGYFLRLMMINSILSPLTIFKSAITFERRKVISKAPKIEQMQHKEI